MQSVRMGRMRRVLLGLTLGLTLAVPAAAEELRVLEERLATGPKVSDLVSYAYQTNPTILAAP